MKTIFSLILFMGQSLFLSAQIAYYNHSMKADTLYQEGKYADSGKSFDTAFAVKTGTASDYYDAACSWALAGETDKALSYLEQSIDQGWSNKKHLEQDEDLKTLHSRKEWTILLATLQKNINDFEKGLNQPLKEQLELLYAKDQTLRQLMSCARSTLAQGSDEIIYYFDLMREIDSLCVIEVEAIIEEHGWLGKSEVGKKGNSAIWLVIQHAPLETQEKYLPLLRASVLKGESEPSDLAYLEDRILIRNGKKQLYGSQYKFNRLTKEKVFQPIDDYKNVDKRREAVGLEPLEIYAKRANVKLPEYLKE